MCVCVCVCVCVSGVIYHTGNNGVASAELPKVYRACFNSDPIPSLLFQDIKSIKERRFTL